MKTTEIHISGRVQGVGFRPFIFNLAEEFQLKGYVSNDELGVIIVCQGENSEQFFNDIHHRKPKSSEIIFSEIKEIKTAEIFDNFYIKPTEKNIVVDIPLTPDFATLRRDEIQFIKQSLKFDFWNDLITKKHRNTIRNNKNKYYNILKGKNNLHHLIKLQIIDKIYQLLNCANSPQETPINKGILKTKETALNTINGENAQLEQTNRQCLVTGLRIDMQRKNSVYLSNAGLLWYYKNDIKTFLQLQNRFLTSEKRKLKIIEQIYYIAHNIRNTKTNEYHNRNKFVERNYNVNQLQFNF